MRVLAVDDSALMRKWLTECFAAVPGVECRTARDGADALAKIAEFDPDVVTLDINMPAMDGLTCLARVMTDMPRPVVMVSSLTEKGALVTLEALNLGAVDYIAKPDGTVSHDLRTIFPDLVAKVRAAAGARTRRPRLREPAIPHRSPQAVVPGKAIAAPVRAGKVDLVLVGASTGGPSALEDVLFPLDSAFPAPILIAQHMPARFTAVFARRLSEQGALPVTEVSGPTPLLPGRAYLARGDADVIVTRRAGRLSANSVPADASRTWNPSVNRMVESAMAVVPPERLVGVLLTGMGDDGARALADLHRAGGSTIAESEASATIYGMPRELVALGGAGRVLDADRIAGTLRQMVM